MVASCATPPPAQTYHNADSSALVVQSFDEQFCAGIAPTGTNRVDNSKLLDQAKTFNQHQTAVIILENYTEPQLGSQFRERSVGWFVGLRGLGYQHIFFLKGNGMKDPEGLTMLARYD
ncbi:MAG TPA: hypothetical protein VF988_02110 [Verrucomicrobiae bacterium]